MKRRIPSCTQQEGFRGVDFLPARRMGSNASGRDELRPVLGGGKARDAHCERRDADAYNVRERRKNAVGIAIIPPPPTGGYGRRKNASERILAHVLRSSSGFRRQFSSPVVSCATYYTISSTSAQGGEFKKVSQKSDCTTSATTRVPCTAGGEVSLP